MKIINHLYMRKNLFFIFCILLSLHSCGKDSPIDQNKDTGENNSTINNWSRGKIVSIIIYNNDSISENTNKTYTYDNLGREIGFTSYLQGKLVQEFKNYSYNNKECSYTLNNYSENKLVSTRKCKVVYYDNSWNRGKLVSSIMYEENGTSEYSNISYNYDSQGREIGFTFYHLGKLTQEFKNYSYNSKECTYTFDNYIENKLQSTRKCKVVYYDNSLCRSKLVNDILFEENDTGEYLNMTYSYDSQGREIGFTHYSQGNLIREFKNYSYNNKECTYTCNYYSNGTFFWSQKYKVLYY